MKKIISLTIALCLVFGSFSFIFASATSWDTTDQANLQTIKNQLSNTSGGSIYYMISQINAAMRFSNKTIANWLADIENHLASALYYEDGGTSRSITWWLKEAVLDLDQMVGTGSGSILYYLNMINTRLGYINNNASTINTNTSNIKIGIDDLNTSNSAISTKISTLIEDYMVPVRSAITTYLPLIKTDTDSINTTLTTSDTWSWNSWTSTLTNNNEVSSFSRSGNILTQAVYGMQFVGRNVVYGFTKMFNQAYTGYNTQQIAKNWLTLQNSNFTPTSQTNGIYSWLANIQEPVARLSYVHASDEEIAAREKAEANQTAVVNNFIDSNGSGAATPSDFSSISSLSSGYQSNFGSDASVSGIFNIFNSNNMSWFSSETYNQLDTTNNNMRTISASLPNTPLLDQKIADIYEAIGLDNDR